MSSNPLTPSFRRVHRIPKDVAHQTVRDAIRDNDQSITDINQSIHSLKGQIDTNATNIKSLTTESIASETTSGSTLIGAVNNQLGSPFYTTQQSDDGAKILAGDSTPVSITLSPSVTLPWFTTIGNDSTSSVSITPGSPASIYGVTSISPGCYVLVYYDGSTFWSEGIQYATDSTPGIVQPDDSTLVIDSTSGLLRTNGLTATITTTKLTSLGADGSMTFVGGILTAQTPAT